MKTSIIRYRVADFLKQSAPFDAISEEDLLELAATGRVSFHEAGEFVFRKNQQRKPWLWVIQQGTVEIIDEAAEGHRLHDLLGSGDVFGLGYFLRSESYFHSARTASDVILYSIDAQSFAVYVAKYPRVARFLAAQFSVSERYKGVLQTAVDEKLAGTAAQPASWLDAEGPSPELLRTRLRVFAPEQPLSEAAREMADSRRDAVAVVDDNGAPLGIITHRELHARLAAASSGAGDTCQSVMTTRFQTAAPNLSAEAYLLRMMRRRCSMLAVTQDGTPDGRLEGLLGDRDLSHLTGRDLSLLVSEMRDVRTSVEWRILVKQAQALKTEALTGPATFSRVAEVASLFGAALAESMVRAAQAETAAAEGTPGAVVPCCWLLFGGAGRGELIEPLQPEIGVVYEDPPHEQKADMERYFRTIAEKVAHHMSASGLEKPLTAGNERDILHFRSLSDWKEFFRGIITNPIECEIYAARRFLDFRMLAGESRLERELTATIIENLRTNRQFIPILANDTLEHLPPMTFFHGLVIEFDGAQKQTLDLGLAALCPIIDAARVYSLAAGSLDAKSTLERLDLAAATVPEAETVFHEAAGAFRVASYYAAVAAMNSSSRSPLIEPNQLTKYDQRLLKTTFESVQKLIEFTSTPSQWKQRM